MKSGRRHDLALPHFSSAALAEFFPVISMGFGKDFDFDTVGGDTYTYKS
jgi:hypothetical protein